MRRRDFIAALGGAAARPLAAHAQPRLPVIGLLHPQSRDSYVDAFVAFYQSLAEAGYTEGRDVTIEYRWVEGHFDRIPALAAELVRARPAVIVVLGSTPGALALKAATQAIPIVFQIGPDPVGAGLVSSLNRPGGNLTGVTVLNVEVIAKRLELSHQLLPAVSLAAFLVNPTNVAQTQAELPEMRTAAKALGVELLVVDASTPAEVETAFATAIAARAGALFVSGESLFSACRQQIVALAASHNLPTIHQNRADAVAGGLMSYGNYLPAAYRVAGTYVGRVLKGESPANLPVQQVSKIELVINMKTAHALGLTIPETLLATADEVIQ
jgi:putative ABC transport system substrate-binding protein